MWKKPLSLFTAPVFPGDEEKTARARQLMAIANALCLGTLIYTALLPLLAPELIPRMYLVAPMYPVIFSMYWLIRRGRLRQAGLLMVIGIWAVLIYSAAISGGVQAPAFGGNIVVILSAAILLDLQTALVFAGLSALSGLGMIYAQDVGWLPVSSTLLNTPISTWLAQAIYFSVSAALLSMAIDTIRGALARAEMELQERRRAEQNLRVSEEKFYKTFHASPIGLALQQNGKFKEVNEAFLTATGYTREEMLGRAGLDLQLFADPADRRLINEALESQGRVNDFQFEFRRRSGEIGIGQVSIEPIDVAGSQTLVIATQDITENRNLQKAQVDLLASMQRRTTQLQTAAEVSRAVSSVLDLDLLLPRIVEVIRGQFDYYYVGLFLIDETRRQVILRAATGAMGKAMLDSGHALDISDSSMIGWCVGNKQARIALDVGADAVRFKNPSLPLTRSEMALPLISRGEVLGAMTIQSDQPSAFSPEDITALQTMSDQVANAIENALLFMERTVLINELEARNTELERFTYTVSHDLRSPLITMRGFVGFLEQDAVAGNMERLRSDVERIASATDKMEQLLSELLELSRVGRAMNPAELAPFGDIAREAVERVRGRLEAARVRVEIEADLPQVLVDRERLVEVVQNLVDNAAKFMGGQTEACVHIGLWGMDTEDRAVFFVRDNGVGIEPRFHERIFGLFNKLDPNSEGTGIGLALVKRIVEIHGGRIWVESDGKNGSVFYFSLPHK
jgi:PAS domain S-box-containing protein